MVTNKCSTVVTLGCFKTSVFFGEKKHKKTTWKPDDTWKDWYISYISSRLSINRLYIGFSRNSGTPKWMVKIVENPIKMDDLGVPLFLETPIYCL